MVWALDMDDFSGSFCNQGQYPLIKTLQLELGESGARAQRRNSWTVSSSPPELWVPAPSQEVTLPQHCDFTNVTHPSGLRKLLKQLSFNTLLSL